MYLMTKKFEFRIYFQKSLKSKNIDREKILEKNIMDSYEDYERSIKRWNSLKKEK